MQMVLWSCFVPGRSSAVAMSFLHCITRSNVRFVFSPNKLQYCVVSYYDDMRVVFATGEPMMLAWTTCVREAMRLCNATCSLTKHSGRHVILHCITRFVCSFCNAFPPNTLQYCVCYGKVHDVGLDYATCSFAKHSG